MDISLADFSPALSLEGQRINVDADSRRIAVRVASWDEVHSGFGEKVRIPRKVNVDAAHVGVANLDDGSTLRVATLPMDTMHAPRNLAALHAASWYENSGKGVARVRYSVDDEGIRADGILFDDIDEPTLDRVLAASASGDWRSAIAIKRFSDFEKVPADFVGSCIVNVPGYSDTFTKNVGNRFSLTASSHTIVSIEEEDTALTAAGVSIDDLRDQYRAQMRQPEAQAEVAASPEESGWGWVEDVQIEPNLVIIERDGKHFSASWTVDENGSAVFGDETEVRQTWTPVGAAMTAAADSNEDPLEGNTMTASGSECDGTCESCTCGAREAEATVTITASSLEKLVEHAGKSDDFASSYLETEVLEVLTAGGFRTEADPRDARIDALEAAVIKLAFND